MSRLQLSAALFLVAGAIACCGGSTDLTQGDVGVRSPSAAGASGAGDGSSESSFEEGGAGARGGPHRGSSVEASVPGEDVSPVPEDGSSHAFDASGRAGATTVVYQAESATLLGGAKRYEDSAASAGGGVAYLNETGDGIEFRAAARANRLAFRYATANKSSLSVFVNGSKLAKLELPATGSYSGSYEVVRIALAIAEGDRVTIARDLDDGPANADEVALSFDSELGAVACAARTPLSGGTPVCSSTAGKLANGVEFSVWLSDRTTGTNCGQFYGVDAAFKAHWSMGPGGDFLARAGLQWNETQSYDQLGSVSADYAFVRNTSNATAFIGIYGWSNMPLVEYYIIEEWIGWNPASTADKRGTFSADGGTYDVYTHTQVDQPSIHGQQTFPQFFSIRTEPRQCGHISITEHYKEWARLGLNLGKMYEAKVLVEAMGGEGTVDFTHASVTAN